MRITPKNTWGATGQLEAQRSDLWVLDLSSAVFLVTAALGRVTRAAVNTKPYLDALPALDDVPIYCQRVDFPARRLADYTVRRDNASFTAPSYAEKLNVALLTFVHEFPKPDQLTKLARVHALFEAWRAVCAAGQGYVSRGASGLVLSLSDVTAGADVMPDYAADVGVQFLGGGSNDVDATNDQAALSQGTRYLLKNAWPVEVQLDNVSYQGAQAYNFRVSLQADDVIPVA